MEVLFLIIPISLVLIAIIAAALLWAIRSRQYDDLDRAAIEPLMDDDEPTESDH
jgi:cbb3-type cytochrome oxidase maturation protein